MRENKQKREGDRLRSSIIGRRNRQQQEHDEHHPEQHESDNAFDNHVAIDMSEHSVSTTNTGSQQIINDSLSNQQSAHSSQTSLIELVNNTKNALSATIRSKPPATISASKSSAIISSYHSSTHHDNNDNTMSSCRNYPTYETNFLSIIIRDIGLFAHGVVAIELWSFRDDDDKLYIPKGGMWVDNSLHNFDCDDCFRCTHSAQKNNGSISFDNSTSSRYSKNNITSSCLACRLFDDNHSKFIQPGELSPGVGIGGALWADVGRATSVTTTSTANAGVGLNSNDSENCNFKIDWRGIVALSNDPDQPYSERLNELSKSKLRWAAGVPFCINDSRGMVIYYAKATVNETLLQSDTNTNYILNGTNFIGSAWSLNRQRLETVQERQRRIDEALRRMRTKLQVIVWFGGSLDNLRSKHNEEDPSNRRRMRLSSVSRVWTKISNNNNGATTNGRMAKGSSSNDNDNRWKNFKAIVAKELTFLWNKKIKATLRKFRGANVRSGPPMFTLEQSIWTFVGSFVTFMSILKLNNLFLNKYGPTYAIVIGPMSSLTGSIYVLTAAPASQPKNALLAHICAMIIGILFGYAKDTVLPLWCRQALSVSLFLTVSSKLGFIHAPASGTALAFADGNELSWRNIPSMICAILIAITLGSIMNNLNSKRQYPTGWGMMPIIELWNEKIRPFLKTSPSSSLSVGSKEQEKKTMKN